MVTRRKHMHIYRLPCSMIERFRGCTRRTNSVGPPACVHALLYASNDGKFGNSKHLPGCPLLPARICVAVLSRRDPSRPAGALKHDVSRVQGSSRARMGCIWRKSALDASLFTWPHERV